MELGPGIRRLFRLPSTVQSVEHDVDAELTFHLDTRIDDLVARGLAPNAARDQALRELGDLCAARQELSAIDRHRVGRDRQAEWRDWLWQDLRFAGRSLRRQPSFLVATLLTLALGIGANAAIFSVVNAVLVRPLPFADPDRLVSIWPDGATLGGVFVMLRDQNRSFDGLAGYGWRETEMSLTGSGDPIRVTALPVSTGLFTVLGVRPELGRTFMRGEDEPGRGRVALVSHAFWRQQFGGIPEIVGRQIRLDGISRTVLGIMPAELHFPSVRVELWVPSELDPSNVGVYWGGGNNLRVVARLKPGVTLAQGRADAAQIVDRSRSAFPWRMPDDWGRGIDVVPLKDAIVGGARPALLVLFGAVGVVLLIACVNVANLLLARAASREREIAIRAALGAGRRRVVRQLLTESVLIGLLGAAAGLLLAFWIVRALVVLLPADTARVAEIGIDGRVLGFTLSLALLTGVAFGLAPALRASRANLQTALAGGARPTGETPMRRRLSEALVVAQVALAVVLVVGAGLLMKSFWLLHRVDFGFQAERVVVANVPVPSFPDDTVPRSRVFYDAVLEHVRALPQVRSAAVTSALPFGGFGSVGSAVAVSVEGHPTAPRAPAPMVVETAVSPDYFRAMGIPMRRGRTFTDADREGASAVALIDETAARRLWLGENPVGRGIKQVWMKDWITVVGVVGSVKRDSLSSVSVPSLYLPSHQSPFLGSMHLVVRTDRGAEALAPSIRAAVAEVDPNVPVIEVQTLSELVSQSAAGPRFTMFLLAAFAGVALLLGAVGIYGVIAYTVARRTREVGVRMALGARPRDVLRMVLREGSVLTALGMALGLMGAFVVSRLLAGLLYGVRSNDPAVFVVAPVVLTAVALLASLAPARRAARVDPLIAMRAE